jgi:hypothetical protein
LGKKVYGSPKGLIIDNESMRIKIKELGIVLNSVLKTGLPEGLCLWFLLF